MKDLFLVLVLDHEVLVLILVSVLEKKFCSFQDMVEMSSRKMPQRYLYTVHEESGIPSTRTTRKKGETGRGIGGAL